MQGQARVPALSLAIDVTGPKSKCGRPHGGRPYKINPNN